jgi:hypothetical protein
MYPHQELSRLAVRKAALRRSIALRRVQCAGAAARVTRPLAWLDRALAFWRRLSPLAAFAAVPLGFLATRTVFPRLKTLGSLLRWGPLVFAAIRRISSVVQTRAGPAPSTPDPS